MKTTMKRFFSGLVAISMTFAGASVVYAEGGTAAEYSTNATPLEYGTGTVTLPTIDVTLPTATDSIVLNPFDLEENGQLYSGEYKVINNSDVPLSMTFTQVLAETAGGTVAIVTKAPSATGLKQAMVSLEYVDGSGKTTSKPIGTEANDIAVSTVMAPKGGTVKYTFTGSTTVNPVDSDKASDPWTSADKIKVANAFKFTANTYTVYEIKKSAVLYSSDSTTMSVANGTEESAIGLPSCILGDSKELPVEWECAGYSATTAGDYVFTAKLADGNDAIYKIADTVTLPSITVTVKAAG